MLAMNALLQNGTSENVSIPVRLNEQLHMLSEVLEELVAGNGLVNQMLFITSCSQHLTFIEIKAILLCLKQACVGPHKRCSSSLGSTSYCSAEHVFYALFYIFYYYSVLCASYRHY
jgi:hypothetical protein